MAGREEGERGGWGEQQGALGKGTPLPHFVKAQLLLLLPDSSLPNIKIILKIRIVISIEKLRLQIRPYKAGILYLCSSLVSKLHVININNFSIGNNINIPDKFKGRHPFIFSAMNSSPIYRHQFLSNKAIK